MLGFTRSRGSDRVTGDWRLPFWLNWKSVTLVALFPVVSVGVAVWSANQRPTVYEAETQISIQQPPVDIDPAKRRQAPPEIAQPQVTERVVWLALKRAGILHQATRLEQSTEVVAGFMGRMGLYLRHAATHTYRIAFTDSDRTRAIKVAEALTQELQAEDLRTRQADQHQLQRYLAQQISQLEQRVLVGRKILRWFASRRDLDRQLGEENAAAAVLEQALQRQVEQILQQRRQVLARHGPDDPRAREIEAKFRLLRETILAHDLAALLDRPYGAEPPIQRLAAAREGGPAEWYVPWRERLRAAILPAELEPLRANRIELIGRLAQAHKLIERRQAMVRELKQSIGDFNRRFLPPAGSGNGSPPAPIALRHGDLPVISSQGFTFHFEEEDFSSDLESNRELYRMYKKRLAQAQFDLANTHQRVSIVQSARVRLVSTSQIPLSRLGYALLLGLLLGAACLCWLRAAHPTIITPEQAALERQVRVIGEIPAIERADASSFSIAPQDSRALDAFQLLATNVLRAIPDSPRAVLVTSSGPQEGKSTSSANLALAFTRLGQPTVLLSCNLRRPTLFKAFGLCIEHGVADVLRGTASLDEVLKATAHPNLQLITAGGRVRDSTTLLSRPALAELIRQLTVERGYTVVIDSPPCTLVTDALLIAPSVQGLLLVCAARQTTSPQLLRALRYIQEVDAPLLGVVFNEKRKGASAYRYGYYSYGHREVESSGEDPAAQPIDD